MQLRKFHLLLLKLYTKIIVKALALIREGFEVFVDNDTNYEHNMKVEGVYDEYSPNTELY